MDTTNDYQQKAQQFIHQLVKEDFSGASQIFNPTLAQALPEDKLRETWLALIEQVGPFQKILASQSQERQGNQIVTLTGQFEKAAIDFRLVFNPGEEMIGLTYQLAEGTTPYTPPAYVTPSAFHEVDVTVGGGEWALPGTLSLPVGDGPFPAVVLVHGSGPQDRDETIGPNKPFRDLAWGLASQGIAVLRYEKCTKAHGAQFTPEIIAKLTVQEEVIDDALSAAELLRHTSAIDPRRIYVLGHSLGATVAPPIGQQDPALAGLIILAAITRRLEDTVLDQFTYLYSLSGEMTDAQKADLEQLKVKVARAKDPNLTIDVPGSELPLGMSASYLLDLRDYHPELVAKSLDMRLLVLQGGRDYQVTVADDFPAWKEALGKKSNATLKIYPKLYHLFIAGEGPSTPQEYMAEGHVSEEVVQDIAGWIKA